MKYEFVAFDHDLPVKLILHPVEEGHRFIPRHWHESLEISYTLSGRIDEIYVDGSIYRTGPGDIVVINPNEVHSFLADVSPDSSAFTVIISYDFLKQNCPEIDGMIFRCISIGETDEARLMKFQLLREKLDAFVALCREPQGNSLDRLRIMALSYDLLYIMFGDFAYKKRQNNEIQSQRHLDMLTNITTFIERNYREPLSVKGISRHFGFTEAYLCRFFRKHIGMTILQYIHTVRLEKAYRELIHTDRPIVQISYENGFPNVKSFNRVFKEVYTISPDLYRKTKRPSSQGLSDTNHESAKKRLGLGE
ncbi:AraC family transcriptional regulator [Saccharibacillus kuerlensis]|uniref:AraC family transcriptional regulator n=1 Tax=Saccharibacillus kuerlensis TaxID=459527 RepID=A0ABQ2LAB7_9BACL|nr:AraC family transcriptional regulator [Saccharibacillus kuerlensis]GGO08324.1 AraC family transcriptional regulator [Saccharibacillus kuerlensis]